jgi:dephospho-CoA kinase
MIVIGLTGSIGMGKSTAAAMFESLRIPVHEADAEVHKLLGPNGKGARAVGAAFPYFQFPQIYGRKTKSGRRTIKRKELGQIVFNDEKQRKRLEKILHPLVRAAQADFIRKHKINGTKIVVLDIPLLFETGGESRVDYTLVVSAPRNVQRQRVLARPGMDEKRFRAILKQQMPDGEKRTRADYIVHTGLGRAQTMKEIKVVIADIKKREQ